MPALTAQTYRSTLASLVFAISGAAAISLFWWESSPLAHVGIAWSGDALFVADWFLMCVAMMLPTAMPLLAALQRTASRRDDAAQLVGICAMGFLGVWLASGVFVRLGENLFTQTIADSPALPFHQPWLSAALLAAGGAYLLSPFAQKCVSACRSPMGFIARGWTGLPDVQRQAAAIGYRYGLSCFGCCWPLMVAMCAVGMPNPLWMLALTLLMLLQKQSRHGHLLTYGAGLAMLALAVCMGCGLLPAAYAEAGMCQAH